MKSENGKVREGERKREWENEKKRYLIVGKIEKSKKKAKIQSSNKPKKNNTTIPIIHRPISLPTNTHNIALYDKLTKLGILTIQTTSQTIKNHINISKWTNNETTSHAGVIYSHNKYAYTHTHTHIYIYIYICWIHTDAINKDAVINDAGRLLYKYIYLSLYCKGSKRLGGFYCERELETEHKL